MKNTKKYGNSQQLSYFFKAVPALVWQVLFFYLPLIFILGVSFKSVQGYFTLEHFVRLFDSVYLIVILRSISLALFTSMICFFIGYPLAYYMAIRKREWRNFFLFLLIVPFWTNFLVLTYAWFFVLDHDGIVNELLLKLGIISEPLSMLNNYFSVLLVMVYSFLPFMVLPLFTILEKFDLTLIEASRDLGATMRQTFMNVIFPLSLPGVKTGFLLVFVPSFGEFVIPMLIGGDKNMYVGTLISHFFFVGQNKYAGSAFTVLSSLVLFLMIALILYLLSYKPRSKEVAC